VVGHEFIKNADDEPLTSQCFIVQSACLDEQVTAHDIFRVLYVLLSLCHLLLVFDYFLLDPDGLVQEILGLVKLMLLEINASQVIHATAFFLPIFELLKDLCDLMIVQKSLVVVTLMQGISSNVDGLGEITKGQVQSINLIIPWPVIKHDVCALQLLLVIYIWVFSLVDIITETVLLVEQLFLLLV